MFGQILLVLILVMVSSLAAGAVELRPFATGQTTCYNETGVVISCSNTAQDAEKQAGIAWPTPRFTDNANGTVTDNLTGLIWLKDADCRETVGRVDREDGLLSWSASLQWSNALAAGWCGLSDASVPGDWRLPNINELRSLIDYSRHDPPLPDGHPFTNVRSVWYWSSTSNPAFGAAAYTVGMSRGSIDVTLKRAAAPSPAGRLGADKRGGNLRGVWPVRGGT